MHQVIAGLSTGGIYASVALALVMIYQTTHHINFAQGELAMFSTATTTHVSKKEKSSSISV